MIHRLSRSLVHWFNVSFIQLVTGSMAPWFNGSLSELLSGSVASSVSIDGGSVDETSYSSFQFHLTRHYPVISRRVSVKTLPL